MASPILMPDLDMDSTVEAKEYTGVVDPSVYSTRHLSSAEDKNFLFCPQLRTQKTYGKQTVFSKPSTMAYLTMVVLPSWQLLTQYCTNGHEITKTNRLLVGF